MSCRHVNFTASKHIFRFCFSLEFQEIRKTIAENQVTVISGETGCGKTTQVAQFILDDFIERGLGSMCRVVCTQPRRISAISVAQRVAQERADDCGGTNSSVGYQIRLEV
jgi:ATP-dependent RNA helicase DHX36